MTSSTMQSGTPGGRSCCVQRGDTEVSNAPAPGGRQRAARAVLGVLVSAGAVALTAGALAGWWLLWPLAAAAAWFGASHIVAALTGYRGCPELGAIPSIFMRQPLATLCTPWERFDRVLERAGEGEAGRTCS